MDEKREDTTKEIENEEEKEEKRKTKLLPSGWQKGYDDMYKRTYYYCVESGERKWTRPRYELPYGWEEATDSNTGVTYYFNVDFGISQWELPSKLQHNTDSRDLTSYINHLFN